ncbi:MAG: LCP family protein [Selenomonadaceae bacterium]|nr:LCP family protein [Selenomonadaceae bacterium]
MKNRTRENIRRKRKMRQRRRRANLFRWLVFIIVTLTILSLAVFVLYRIYEGANYLYNEYVAMHNSYVERKSARGVDAGNFSGYTNALVLGVDDGISADGSTEGQHADSIFFISMSNDTGKLNVFAIPPDTYVDVKDGTGRIATLYTSGGAPRVTRAVSEFLGVSVHQYVVVSTEAFRDLVDALGGIDMYVEDDMDYEDEEGNISIHLKKGYQHLDGEMAEDFLRYRNTALSDVGRVQRQQKFLKALYQKILQLDTIGKLPEIAEVFKTKVESSAEVFDSAHLANVLRKLSSDPPTVLTLPGWQTQGGVRIWNPNREEIDEKMKEFFPEMSEAER